MTEFLDFNARNLIGQTLLVFATLFPIVNPVGGAPVFLAMTEGLGDAERDNSLAVSRRTRSSSYWVRSSSAPT